MGKSEEVRQERLERSVWNSLLCLISQGSILLGVLGIQRGNYTWAPPRPKGPPILLPLSSGHSRTVPPCRSQQLPLAH